MTIQTPGEREKIVKDLLIHFGVKGMRWGQRNSRSSGGGGGPNHAVSLDAARAHALKTTVRTHGTAALSNADLHHLVTRMNLERQHGQMNPAKVSTGHKLVNEILDVGGNVAKQQALSFGNKYAAKGVEELLKRIA
jgi:hypothetical protein